MADLRIALTISGAVSLGAFHGGALAALLVGMQRLLEDGDAPVRIDAIGGASAGALTGVLAARTLLAGHDPVHVMEEAWVRRPALRNLKRGARTSPFSFRTLEQAAEELIEPDPRYRDRPVQEVPIRMHISLATLRGLHYRIASLRGRKATSDKRVAKPHALEATTYADGGRFVFTPRGSRDEYLLPRGASAAEFALASAANAIGFPPKMLDRTLRDEDKEFLRREEILNFPASGSMWYTDGGTIDNEPLGRVLDLTNEIDRSNGQFNRLHLLIHPHPTAPPNDESWADPGKKPQWTAALVRAFMIQRTQSLYEDLRRVEKVNSRLRWVQRVEEELGELLQDDPEGKVSEALTALLAGIEEDKEKLRAEQRGLPAPVDGPEPVQADGQPDGPDVRTLLARVLQAASGLAGKDRVGVDVVSPLALPEAEDLPIERLLAGEFLGHFGGFLDERLRMSDFVLGYRSMMTWMQGLADYGVEPIHVETAVSAARHRYGQDWDTYRHGEETLRTLPLLTRWRLYALVGRVIVSSGVELFARRRR